MIIPHITIHWITRPAICALSAIAGIGVGDLWLLVSGLLAAWLIDVRSWDAYGRKSNEAPD